MTQEIVNWQYITLNGIKDRACWHHATRGGENITTPNTGIFRECKTTGYTPESRKKRVSFIQKVVKMNIRR